MGVRMYVPRHFALDDRQALVAFMRAHPFGMLISIADGAPAATHLPFVVLNAHGDIQLGTHMARANPNWRSLEAANVLVTFQGPHGYISPRWYTDPQRNVPTWNYAAVHCAGIARVADERQTAKIIECTACLMEGEDGWSVTRADAAYIDRLKAAIVGIEITVGMMTGVQKFSQNHSEADRVRVTQALRASTRPADWELACAMALTSGEGAPPLYAVDHVQLAMPEGAEANARAFYAGLLGFEERPKPPHLVVRGGVWFESGYAALHLGVDSPFVPARKAHPALRCANYAQLVERLIEHDVTVTPDPVAFDGRRHCYVADPFGNRLELLDAALG